MQTVDSIQDSKAAAATTGKRKRRLGARDNSEVLKDLILALDLCHNVTPVYPDEKDQSKKEFQASSPDEIALVKFAEEIGMTLVQRDENYMKLHTPSTDNNPDGEDDEYKIL